MIIIYFGLFMSFSILIASYCICLNTDEYEYAVV